MSTRRSPLLARGDAVPKVVDAVRILETLPRVPQKTPVHGDDGYDGEICRDASRLYIFDGSWKYVNLTAL